MNKLEGWTIEFSIKEGQPRKMTVEEVCRWLGRDMIGTALTQLPANMELFMEQCGCCYADGNKVISCPTHYPQDKELYGV